MSHLYGWTGRILRVYLCTGQMSTMDTMDFAPAFAGGVGIAARIAWQELSPWMDAFDPGNPLFIMTGPLTGTLASGAGRVEVLGIAPQQHPSVFSRSGMGGHWGAELKYAGYDGLVIQGAAPQPVYLWIHDGECELRDATDLWGRGTYSTTTALRAIHGPRTRVISCGQAGERRSRIAIIQTETGNAAGQGGFGGVMGSKNLKAIAVRGTMGVPIARPQAFFDLCMGASREGPRPGGAHGPGPQARHRARQADRAGPQFRMRKCGFCMTPCAHGLVANVQAADGTRASSVAQHCWGFPGVSRSVDPVARALTSDYGLNGWEIAYGAIPWLQMCKQYGLIDRIDGIDIPVPDKPLFYRRDTEPFSSEFVHALLRKVAFREGDLGDALADGTCYAAERLFGGQGVPLLDRIYPRRGGQTAHWTGHWGTGGTVVFPWWLPPSCSGAWTLGTRQVTRRTSGPSTYCPTSLTTDGAPAPSRRNGRGPYAPASMGTPTSATRHTPTIVPNSRPYRPSGTAIEG